MGEAKRRKASDPNWGKKSDATRFDEIVSTAKQKLAVVSSNFWENPFMVSEILEPALSARLYSRDVVMIGGIGVFNTKTGSWSNLDDLGRPGQWNCIPTDSQDCDALVQAFPDLREAIKDRNYLTIAIIGIVEDANNRGCMALHKIEWTQVESMASLRKQLDREFTEYALRV